MPLRNAQTELYGGRLVRPHECPQRAEIVLERIRAVGLGEVAAPARFGLRADTAGSRRRIRRIPGSAWTEWVAAGNLGEAIPDCWPARRMAQRRPNGIAGKLGYYAMAAETSISAGTWEAARAAADVALTAASHLHRGARAAFALCRPPGHHAARDLYGGYCFLNNAAIAAQYLRDQGAARVADPRRRLPSRQRHPGHFLRPGGRALRVPARRSGRGIPLLLRLRGRDRRRSGSGLQLEPAAAPRHRVRRLGRRASRRLEAHRELSPRRARRLPGGGYLRRRPDQLLPARSRRIFPPMAG